MKSALRMLMGVSVGLLISGCTTTDVGGGSASQQANRAADRSMYQPVHYANASIRGPSLVVIPGEIKSNNATFTQKISANNIADYAELELGKANFGVLERSDLGNLLDEISTAVNMGSAGALQRFKRGKFKSTKWFIRFDVLKAEPVASASSGFDGRALGSILGQATGNYQLATAVGSVKTQDEAGVWIVGMRYKLIDANTTEQVATNYFEQKMEIGAKGVSILGVSSAQAGGVTLDSLVQRLVQEGVADLDRKKEGRSSGNSSRSSSDSSSNGGLSRSEVREMQTILKRLGYGIGTPDGLAGRQTSQAISRFQQDNGLSPTGELDTDTVSKLRSM